MLRDGTALVEVRALTAGPAATRSRRSDEAAAAGAVRPGRRLRRCKPTPSGSSQRLRPPASPTCCVRRAPDGRPPLYRVRVGPGRRASREFDRSLRGSPTLGIATRGSPRTERSRRSRAIDRIAGLPLIAVCSRVFEDVARIAASLRSPCSLSACACRRAFAAVPIPKPPAIDARVVHPDRLRQRPGARRKHADERMEPASITKLMTAYVVFEALKEKRLKLDDDGADQRERLAQGGLTELAHVPARWATACRSSCCIKGMIIQSGNDATIALAERLGGTEARLRADHERVRASARHEEHALRRTRAACRTRSTTPPRATSRRCRARSSASSRSYYKYYSHERVHLEQHQAAEPQRPAGARPVGGWHQDRPHRSAGYCLVASAKRGDMRLISVVMGTPSIKAREDASAALLNYGYTFYETAKVKSRGETIADAARLQVRERRTLPVGIRQDICRHRRRAAKPRT